MTNAVEKVIAGDVRTVARLIRDIDDRVPGVRKPSKLFIRKRVTPM
jgi:hypothetical protein